MMRKLLIFICGVVFSSVVLAAEINLYDQPEANAKTIGKIDAAVGIIPIFSSPDKMWVKVGDPRNGNVGWIKASDIDVKNGVNTSFSFTQKMANDGQSIGSPVLQVGTPPKLTPEQVELMRKMDVQRKAVQQNIQNIMHDLGQYYDAQMKLWNQEMTAPASPPPNKK